jgi:hypothetical protein
MLQTTIDLLNKGVAANRADRFRRGNLIHLPPDGSVVIGGDIHGHRRNFERLVTYADLANHPERHLVLQEIIHGGPEDEAGGCLSYQLLFEAVRVKLDFPDRVHVVMGNHDTACISRSEVMKNGKEMNRAMGSALDREFRRASGEVKQAIGEFLFSQPLAIRCENRLWISHSLPADRFVETFDVEVFDRALRPADCAKPGPAYLLTWGRRHSQAALNQLAERLDVDVFVLGHQAQTHGWCQAGENLIILACDHNHGCLIEVDLTRHWSASELADHIVPLASIH